MNQRITVEYLGNCGIPGCRIAESMEDAAQLRRIARASLSDVRSKVARRIRLRRRKSELAGFRAGEMAAHEELSTRVKTAEQLYAGTVEKAEMDCFRVVREIAEDVIGKLAAESTPYLMERIRFTLQRLIQKHEVRILLHSTQADSCRHGLLTSLPGSRVTVESSDTVAPGDAIIYAPGGSIELCWREQLEHHLERLRPGELAAA